MSTENSVPSSDVSEVSVPTMVYVEGQPAEVIVDPKVKNPFNLAIESDFIKAKEVHRDLAVQAILAGLADETSWRFKAGNAVLEYAAWFKAERPNQYDSAYYTTNLCREIHDRVEAVESVKRIRIEQFAHAYVAREQVAKLMGREVANKVSYHLIANHLLKCFPFDTAKLECVVHPNWAEFVKRIIGGIYGLKGYDTVKHTEIDDLRTDHANNLEVTRKSALSPEKLDDELQRETYREKDKGRKAFLAAVGPAMDSMSMTEIMAQVERSARVRKLAVPGLGIDPKNCTPEEAITFVKAVIGFKGSDNSRKEVISAMFRTLNEYADRQRERAAQLKIKQAESA